MTKRCKSTQPPFHSRCLWLEPQDLCDKAASAQSHTLHKLLGFHHLAPGCLVLRTLTTLFWIDLETWDAPQVGCFVATLLRIVDRTHVELVSGGPCLCMRKSSS